jgi:hypothetical protein
MSDPRLDGLPADRWADRATRGADVQNIAEPGGRIKPVGTIRARM